MYVKTETMKTYFRICISSLPLCFEAAAVNISTYLRSQNIALKNPEVVESYSFLLKRLSTLQSKIENIYVSKYKLP